MNVALSSLFHSSEIATAKQPSILDRVLVELLARGPSSARVLSLALSIPERTMSSTLSYAFTKQKLTRTKASGVWAYAIPGDN